MANSITDQKVVGDPEFANLLEELTQRLESNGGVDLEAYLERFPQYADQLEQLVPAMKTLIGLRNEAGDSATGQPGPRTSLPLGSADGTLGDFRIIREIGRGGMGVVYAAQQLSLDRTVALKVLPFAAILDESRLTRFRTEVRAAATLEHPHIVPVYSVGCERGVHFYAMRLIEGKSLAEVISELRCIKGAPSDDVREHSEATSQLTRNLSIGSCAPPRVSKHIQGGPDVHSDIASDTADTKRQLEGIISTAHANHKHEYFRMVAVLISQAADALDYAHAQGVTHRDVKPANLIIDNQGSSWVTDFGLATIESEANVTVTGDLIGTLRYMSPEQAMAKRGVVNHRTDIYSLGATFYELLTLRPVFDGEDRQELLHQIAFQEPRSPRRVNNNVPVDLETICLKTLEKNPAQRYDTAQDVADDLRRFLDHKPIAARPPSIRDRYAKWVHRHRGLMVISAAALVVVMACFAMSTVVAFGALLKTQAAEQQAVSDRDHALYSLYVADIRVAHEEWKNGHLKATEELLDNHEASVEQRDLRGWEWFYLKSLCHQDLATLQGHSAAVTAVAWSPDGNRLATASEDATVKVWDAASKREIVTLLGHTQAIYSLAWSPDGNQLASGGWHDELFVWDVGQANTVLKIDSEQGIVQGLAWSPDGRRIASSGHDGFARVWDATSGQKLMQLAGHGRVVWSVAWSPDGTRLATGGAWEDQSFSIWDTKTGKELQHVVNAHGHSIDSLSWSMDGRRLATASADYRVAVWDTESWQELWKQEAHRGQARSVSWSPNSTVLASGGDDGVIKLWNADDGKEILAIRGHQGGVRSVQWGPMGKRLASGSADGTVKFWDPSQVRKAKTVYGRWTECNESRRTAHRGCGETDRR